MAIERLGGVLPQTPPPERPKLNGEPLSVDAWALTQVQWRPLRLLHRRWSDHDWRGTTLKRASLAAIGEDHAARLIVGATASGEPLHVSPLYDEVMNDDVMVTRSNGEVEAWCHSLLSMLQDLHVDVSQHPTFDGEALAIGLGAEAKVHDLVIEGFMVRQAPVQGYTFSGCKMVAAQFLKARFEDCAFNDCDLTRSVWAGSEVDGLGLRGCDLSGAQMGGLKLKGVDFEDATLSGAGLGACVLEGPTFVGTTLEGVTLDNASLRAVFAKGASFKGAQLSSAALEGGTFVECSFEGAVLRGAMLRGVTFDQCNFEGAVFDDASWTQVRMVDCKLDRVTAHRARLQGVELTRVTAEGSTWADASWEDALLNESNFTGALLERATLVKARWVETRIDAAQVSGARFVESIFVEDDERRFEPSDPTRVDTAGLQIAPWAQVGDRLKPTRPWMVCPVCRHDLEPAQVRALQTGRPQAWAYGQGESPTVVCGHCHHRVRAPIEVETPDDADGIGPTTRLRACRRCHEVLAHMSLYCTACGAVQDREGYAKALWHHVRNNEDDPPTYFFSYKPIVDEGFQRETTLRAPLIGGPVSKEALSGLLSAAGLTVTSSRDVAQDVYHCEAWAHEVTLKDDRGIERAITFRPHARISIPSDGIMDGLLKDPAFERWVDSDARDGVEGAMVLGEDVDHGFRVLTQAMRAVTNGAPFLKHHEGNVDFAVTALDALGPQAPIKPEMLFQCGDGVYKRDEEWAVNEALVQWHSGDIVFRATSGMQTLGLPDLALLRPDHGSLDRQARRLRRAAEDDLIRDLYRHFRQHGLPKPGVPFQLGERTLCWHMTREIFTSTDKRSRPFAAASTAWDADNGLYSHEEQLLAVVLEHKGEDWEPLTPRDLLDYEGRVDPARLRATDDDDWDDDGDDDDWDDDDSEDRDWDDDDDDGHGEAPSPVLCALASAVVPGAGQFMMGQSKRGAILLVSGLLTFCGCGLVNIAAAIDAYQQASRRALPEPD